jgi:hypothetical protein
MNQMTVAESTKKFLKVMIFFRKKNNNNDGVCCSLSLSVTGKLEWKSFQMQLFWTLTSLRIGG